MESPTNIPIPPFMNKSQGSCLGLFIIYEVFTNKNKN